ncbi:uncharacterized protein Dwil_GK22907 [Drosophila willistoni]|uniref:Uncharacterized protein n=1 Tax=Drosophila willistoni TaxID=7260 RepID=B4NNE0_DROWI|nr:uncharacterized protein LOC6652104 [Drosophila willistoni]EDW85879.1 uncharacterized protein Dwil_GK22907 [Drosophila willistoni]
MKNILISVFVIFVAAITLILAMPQHGSINGPSGRFAMTQNWASPPVDLSQPIVFLREATPIHEENQETGRNTKA